MISFVTDNTSKTVKQKLNNPRQIVALGGGMFSMEPENGILDKYILNLVKKPQPKICFLGTASNDGKEYIEMFYKFFQKQQCIPTHLALTDPPKDLEDFILSQDIIHVGGGKTKLIIQKWKRSGLDKIMRKAYDRGIILTGMSAGAICWFEDGFVSGPNDSIKKLQCLGFLEGSFCPHYEDREKLREAYHGAIMKKTIKEGYGVEDGAALHFVNEELLRVVTSRVNARAFKVTPLKVDVNETVYESVYLGDEGMAKRVIDEDIKKRGNIKLVQSFIESINSHKVSDIVKHLTDDHLFRDSIGINVTGIEDMQEAWESCFMLFPDYSISPENIICSGDEIAIFGIASGTVFIGNRVNDENHWKVPASWRALIRGDKIAKWCVYADIEPIRNIRERLSETNGEAVKTETEIS